MIAAAGHPAEQIVHLAELRHVDLVVLGRRGRSKISRWVLGSVSERLMRYLRCSGDQHPLKYLARLKPSTATRA